MALGIVKVGLKEPIGSKYQQLFEVTGDASYPTGGEAYLASDFGFSKLDSLEVLGVNAGGKLVEHDRANKKFLIKNFDYDAVADGGAIEVINASDQSTVKWTVLARGI